jgi:hypothetical protein
MSTFKREIDHLKNAARLLLDVDGWLLDCAFRETGGRLYYAVDTDVINMFLSPRGLSRYADVFERRDENSILLAWLLANFLFLDSGPLSEQRPFLLISPHDEELQRIADALHRRLASLSTYVDVEMDGVVQSLRELVDKTGQSSDLLSSVDGLATWLGNEAAHLVEVFQQRRQGPEMELKRLADLARAGAFMPMDAVIVPESSCPLPRPDIVGNLTDACRFLTTKAEWRERLQKYKGAKKPGYAVDRDAEVLARMDWVNRELDGRVKLVLITGSRDIFMAAADHPDGGYSARYLRHPRSFLGLRDAFAVARGDSESVKADLVVLEWLNLFFPDAVKLATDSQDRRSQVNRKHLEHLIHFETDKLEPYWREMLERLRTVTKCTSLDDYVREWGRHVRTVAVARSIYPTLFPKDSTAAESIAHLLFNKIHAMGGAEGKEDLYEAVYCDSVQTLSQLYSAPAWIGLWATKNSRLEGVKGIPALRFDEDAAAQRYSDKLLDSISVGGSMIDLVEVYRELEQLDPTNYLAHVIHALAYAAKGHWYATSSLCRAAVAVRDCVPRGKRGIRLGREASYLAAVASRRTALNVRDLSDAAKWLDQARSRDEDRAPDCRFDSEQLAIEATRYAFAYFCNGSEINAEAMYATCRRLLDLIGSVTREESDKRVKPWVLRQCLTNFYSTRILILDARLSDVFAVAEDEARSLFMFDEVTQGRRSDSLSRFVFKLSYALWGTSKPARLQYGKEVQAQHPPPFMPFDDSRFQAMQRLAGGVRG